MSGPKRNRHFSASCLAGWVVSGVAILCFLDASHGEDKAFDLFPTGKPWLDVRIPRYDDQDVLTSMMHSEALTRQDAQKLKMDGLTLVMFQSSGEISLRLKTKQGLFDIATSKLQTHSTTFIEHAQFEMRGDRMTFDTSKQQGTLQGNVEMRIFGVPVPRETPAIPAATQPVSGEEKPQSQSQSQSQPDPSLQPQPQPEHPPQSQPRPPQPELRKGDQPAGTVEVVQLTLPGHLHPKSSKP